MSGVQWVLTVLGVLCLIAGVGVAIGLWLAEGVGEVLGEDQDVGTRGG